MESRVKMSFLLKFIKEHRLYVIATVSTCVIFAAVFMMYGLPFGAFVYPSVLSIVVMLAILVYGAVKERGRHLMVQDAMLRKELIDETMLPEALTCIEEDYRELVRTLQTERTDAITAANLKYDNLSEYYTLWAHQIKTPIASMRLKLSNTDNELVRSVNSDLLRVEQYVDMVMTYVRLDSKTTDYRFRNCDIGEIIRQNIKKFSSDFIIKKLKLLYEPKEVFALTDEKWLGFVIEQILSNAVKYTQKGSVSVRTSEEDEYVTVEIEDTGMGISSENMPRIFDLGFTGYNGRTDNRASGIGMYLCKRICDNLGIEISARSTVGVGTCVSLKIRRNVTEM